MRPTLLLAVLVMSLLAACVGDIGGEPGDGSLCPAASPGRVGLQRLTRAEYNRTVRDLFGVTSAPADAFPPDSLTSGFDNNAKSLTISPQLAELLFDAAEVIAAEALQNEAAEILVCDPADAGADACARTILASLARRVYRRPASEAEIDDLMVLVDFAATEGDGFAAGIEYALQAMLVAPQFLYRGIPAGAESAAGASPLDDYALATRLSYFLWGSTPDDALLDRAGEGVLHDAAVLRAELDRMLADPKAAALYDGFVSQWLQLGKLGSAAPDPMLFPAFDDALRQAMWDETRLFFDSIVANDASPLALIDGTATFANEGLAAIYGVAGPSGPELVPIQTDPGRRAGFLTMPAVLTMTSGPKTPNIVRRGVWLAETILCAKPPPPPDGVPPPPDPKPNETERERLARHRSNPVCASCHDLIDPLGFAFESYDAIGAWRDTADGVPVDDQGKLPDGRTFAGVPEMVALLESGGAFPSCVTEKLMTYALGRTMRNIDQCAVTAIGAAHVTPEAKLSDLLWAVVQSDAFQKQDAAGAP
jgi:uncharacterized protein DUF1592/uncharacterized protein DUF1588/uncharacterized protein DUF1587/uncharacterized protein DUF1595/uncharacterized protein DUF1585